MVLGHHYLIVREENECRDHSVFFSELVNFVVEFLGQ